MVYYCSFPVKVYREVRYLHWVLFLLLAIAPLIWKMAYLAEVINASTGIDSFGAMQVLLNDAIIYALILLLFYLAGLGWVPYMLSVVCRLLAITVLLAYVADFWVIKNFNSHLVVSDAIKYAPYSLQYAQQIYHENMLGLLLGGVILGALLWMVVLGAYRIGRKRIHATCLISIMGLLLLPVVVGSDGNSYVHSWAYKNVIEHNLTILSEGKRYSQEFIRRFHFEEAALCEEGDKGSPNIILLMVESLSAYQSSYFSGVRDWTPNLDKISRENRAFTNFYANGFTTEDAELSLLAGRLPIYAPSSYSNGGETSFGGFFHLTDALPEVLGSHGYETEFLTSADLSFSNTGGWAKSIGFDYIEGHEHAFYNNWERFHFKAAPDEALYQRLLARMDHNKGGRYFLFAKTVSTHHPFINPNTKNRSEEEAFRYADKQIGQFYQQLIERAFFENGVLIIVGDHHSMVPLKRAESNVLGQFRAAARVPLVVAGDGGGAVDRAYQQIDVFNSIRGMVSGETCHSAWVGDFFNDKPASYIAHRRGDARHMVSVFSGDVDYLVSLNGDESAVVGSYQDSAAVKQVVGKVNSIRISRQKNDSDAGNED